MAHAKAKGFHNMVGVVDAANEASLKLHAKHGFTTFGVMKEGGYKFDRWLDVAFIQAIL
jgi:L-amino acid N-acyltransferase